jgi:hypothetical protein
VIKISLLLPKVSERVKKERHTEKNDRYKQPEASFNYMLVGFHCLLKNDSSVTHLTLSSVR